MKRYVVLIVISLSYFFVPQAQAQTSLTAEEVMERMEEQVNLYPQEKLHLHLDRTSFFQGEKIWFKAYLTDAFLQPSETGSRYIYVELINPADSVVQRVMIRPENELFYGHLPLAEDLTEGAYTLRAYTRYMENMGEDSYFRQKIQVNSVIASQIRPHYTLDYLWDKQKVNVDLYYTVGYSAEKVKPDKLQLLTWQGNEQMVRMDKDTVARFAYDLPSEGEPQQAIYLKADNFQHYIPLATATDDYDVTFYPEGGYLINGTLTRIAFKAVNSAGLAEEITGTVYNSKGEKSIDVKTMHAGMGLLGIVADEAEAYYLECVNSDNVKKRFELPKGVSDTYGLQANVKEDNLFVNLLYSSERPVADDLYVLIHRSGEVFFFDSFPEKRKEMVLSWDMLPQGILQVLLLDKEMNPLSERLVFSPLREEPVLRMKTDKPSYPTREKISVTLNLEDEHGAPLEGNLSVAITDSRDVDVDSLQTIVSTLLLTSELKGHIENPAYYFRNDDPKVTYALDLLMMTQGWRRYDISQTLSGNYAYPEIQPETGLAVSGTVTQIESTKPIAKGEVTMMLTNNDNKSFFDQTLTNEKGEFVFNQIEYPDSARLFIQSLNVRGKDYVQLRMDAISYPPVGKLDRNKILIIQEEVILEEDDLDLILKKAEERAKFDENMQVVNLKEVFVTAAKIEKEREPERSIYASEYTTVVDFEKKMETTNYLTLADLFHEIPGVQVVTEENNRRLIIRGYTTIGKDPYALIMVEGMATEDAQILETINVRDIATVEVYKGPEAAIFGSRGGLGVVNIVYKKGAQVGVEPTYNKIITTLLGFQQPVEFYAPKYETPQQKSSYLPDLRTTIYWKPDLLTDRDGKVQLEFYSADTPTVYDVVVEGLTIDGVPVRRVEKIQVK